MWTAKELKRKATLKNINGSELKIEDETTRIWLEPDDTIYVEKFNGESWEKYMDYDYKGLPKVTVDEFAYMQEENYAKQNSDSGE